MPGPPRGRSSGWPLSTTSTPTAATRGSCESRMSTTRRPPSERAASGKGNHVRSRLNLANVMAETAYLKPRPVEVRVRALCSATGHSAAAAHQRTSPVCPVKLTGSERSDLGIRHERPWLLPLAAPLAGRGLRRHGSLRLAISQRSAGEGSFITSPGNRRSRLVRSKGCRRAIARDNRCRNVSRYLSWGGAAIDGDPVLMLRMRQGIHRDG
jgi:hypothetical protein